MPLARTSSRPAGWSSPAPPRSCASTRRCARATSATEAPPVTEFLQQVVSGLASGGIYGSLALALVLIYRSTGVVNFAQGEMATLSAFVCWSLMDHGLGL